MIDINLLMSAVEDSRDGITIADISLPDQPLIYVNPAFERMTGYSREEVLGKNCRYLQQGDNSQEGVKIIRDAINKRTSCVARIINYRKDGMMFWNELSLSPIFDSSGNLTHYLGIQKDVTNEMLLMDKLINENLNLKSDVSELSERVNVDPLTGLHNRRYLDNQIKTLWEIALHQSQSFYVMMVDIDYFKKYNDKYGHQAGDTAIQRVARALNSSFLKTTDFVARYGGEEFIVVGINSDLDNVINYAKKISQQIKSLGLINKESQYGVITASIGVAHCDAATTNSPEQIIKNADQALYQAKSLGRDQVSTYEEMRPESNLVQLNISKASSN